jgi:hypothetical protein
MLLVVHEPSLWRPILSHVMVDLSLGLTWLGYFSLSWQQLLSSLTTIPEKKWVLTWLLRCCFQLKEQCLIFLLLLFVVAFVVVAIVVDLVSQRHERGSDPESYDR